MYRIISFIIISSFVSTLLFFHFQYGHNPFSSEVDHHAIRIEIPNDKTPPTITGEVRQD